MKMTKATDYALIFLKHLCLLEDGRISSVKIISEQCNIPKRFLANIAHTLSKAGIIFTIKGMDGGVKLSRDGGEITIREVVEAMEGNIRFVECQAGVGVCSSEELCDVKHFWDNKLEGFLDTLNSTTIKDLSEFSTNTLQSAPQRLDTGQMPNAK